MPQGMLKLSPSPKDPVEAATHTRWKKERGNNRRPSWYTSTSRSDRY